MKAPITISAINRPHVIDVMDKLSNEIFSIEQYACLDFNLIKIFLNSYNSFKKTNEVPGALIEKTNILFTELQYIDALQQRLGHIETIQQHVRADILSKFESVPYHVKVPCTTLLKLNHRQFNDAISIYTEVTGNIQQMLAIFLKDYDFIFKEFFERSSLFEYNTKILSKASGVSVIYFDDLLQYDYSNTCSSLEEVQKVLDISKIYTMEHERKIMRDFLAEELGQENAGVPTHKEDHTNLF
jgi:hypothetical protein